MEDDDQVVLRFHWTQAGTIGVDESDINVMFYPSDSDRLIAEITVPNTMVQTGESIRAYRHPNTTIALPSSFESITTTNAERLEMFRHAILKASE